MIALDVWHELPRGDRMAKPFGIQLKGVRVRLYSCLDRRFFALLGCNLFESSLFTHIHMVSPLAGRLCVR